MRTFSLELAQPVDPERLHVTARSGDGPDVIESVTADGLAVEVTFTAPTVVRRGQSLAIDVRFG